MWLFTARRSGSGRVVVASLTIQNSGARGQSGGGVYVDVNVVALLERVVVRNNQNDCCGAGMVNFGNTTLANSVVSGNVTNHWGGGIYNYRRGSLLITRSTLSGKAARHSGGAVFRRRGVR